MTDEVRLGNVMVDCGDEQTLQRFYGQLLNWETTTLFGRPAVRSAEGVVFLGCTIAYVLYKNVLAKRRRVNEE